MEMIKKRTKMIDAHYSPFPDRSGHGRGVGGRYINYKHMKAVNYIFISILLSFLPFLVGCHNDADLSEGYLTAVITGYNPTCGACILTFTDNKTEVERLLGISETNSYQAVNLNEDLSTLPGRPIKVKVRKATGNEIPACTGNYPAVFVIDYISITFSYNREFEIPVKGSVLNKDEKYLLRFDSVLTDSRCPEGVNCFWQGIAGVRFTITEKNSTPEKIDLYTWNNPGMNWCDSVTYKHLNIRLLELNPYPSTNVRYGYDSYKAKIIITLKK